MHVKNAKVAWLPVIQLLVAVSLLLAATWQYACTSYDKAVAVSATTTVPFHVAQDPVTPPYTFPNGGRTLFPDYRLVALYGAPDAPVLGVLGRQGPEESVKRVRQLAEQYQPYSKQYILPTFEIIATVASASPTENHDYSLEVPVSSLRTWVATAKKHGVYVILDLQSGRTDFLTQAKQLEPLLVEPNVGLALDPEWRLTSTQVPLKQIGSVSANEVNQTASWLATLTRRHHLPQKVFLLHQFRNDMLPDRQNINTAFPELAVAIQMDGQGSQPQKQDTWRAILRQPPQRTYYGWKNFYEKDSPMLNPKQTMSISPQPWYISFQ